MFPLVWGVFHYNIIMHRLCSRQSVNRSYWELRGFEVYSTKIGSTPHCCANNTQPSWTQLSCSHVLFCPDNHHYFNRLTEYTVTHRIRETSRLNMTSLLQAGHTAAFSEWMWFKYVALGHHSTVSQFSLYCFHSWSHLFRKPWPCHTSLKQRLEAFQILQSTCSARGEQGSCKSNTKRQLSLRADQVQMTSKWRSHMHGHHYNDSLIR